MSFVRKNAPEWYSFLRRRIECIDLLYIVAEYNIVQVWNNIKKIYTFYTKEVY